MRQIETKLGVAKEVTRMAHDDEGNLVFTISKELIEGAMFNAGIESLDEQGDFENWLYDGLTDWIEYEAREFKAHSDDEKGIVHGGGISKPPHMSDEQWAEFKRTPEYQSEVSRLADPEDPPGE